MSSCFILHSCIVDLGVFTINRGQAGMERGHMVFELATEQFHSSPDTNDHGKHGPHTAKPLEWHIPAISVAAWKS